MARFLLSMAAAVSACIILSTQAAPTNGTLETRAAAADNIVYITSASDMCIMLPRYKHTDIGASEYPGGMKTACIKPYSKKQTKLSSKFFKSVHVSKKNGRSGGRQVQMTACIRPSKSQRLNRNDGGGQYDGHGGEGGRGNPAGSQCLGFGKNWVSIVEPDANRMCLRCCENASDCDVSQDTSGCPAVIPGNYDGCN